ncbi:MAG: response regulator [Pyrinomonadaceae bacterium]
MGRRLLVADDSLTIQKVVDLTFSEEGMEVTTVSDGDQAAFDVVLADVFMPGRSGYEVCAAIKHNERFHHIPVMLLVGSFEPFDEAEARRVGADDVLTKPFQSIRQLVNRVGTLLGGRPAGGEAPTRRLSALGLERSEEASSKEQSPDELMSTAEIELTADTLPLDEHQTEQADSLGHGSDHAAGANESQAETGAESFAPGNPDFDKETASWAEVLASNSEPATRERETAQPFRVEQMDDTSKRTRAAAGADDRDDVLLDLGDFDSQPAAFSVDDILEIEAEAPATFPGFEPQPQTLSADSFSSGSAREGLSLDDRSYEAEFAPEWSGNPPRLPQQHATTDNESLSGNQLPDSDWQIVPRTATFERVTDEDESAFQRDQQQASYGEHRHGESASDSGGTLYERRRNVEEDSGMNRLSPEDIEAIARRVVEQISDKVVREIAWDVVPDLAELLIKQRLDEKD